MTTEVVDNRLTQDWKIPRLGEIVEGDILAKHGSAVFVDLGFGTGIIYGKEYQDGRDMLKHREAGDSIVTKITELENEEGYIELSIKEAGREKFWKEAVSVVSEKKPVVLRALEANRGGLVY